MQKDQSSPGWVLYRGLVRELIYRSRHHCHMLAADDQSEVQLPHTCFGDLEMDRVRFVPTEQSGCGLQRREGSNHDQRETTAGSMDLQIHLPMKLDPWLTPTAPTAQTLDEYR